MSQLPGPSLIQWRLSLPGDGRGRLQGCRPRGTAHKTGQEVNDRGGRGFKDHLIEILQNSGLQVEFDSHVSFGLFTVFCCCCFLIGGFHIKFWISHSLKILEDLKINTGLCYFNATIRWRGGAAVIF